MLVIVISFPYKVHLWLLVWYTNVLKQLMYLLLLFLFFQVYVLGFPQNELVNVIHKNKKVALLLLILMIVTMVVSIVSFVFIIIRAAKREMHLCAALIKQMEATQQAERKSMNKSLAFASASHDVRASLAGLTGLIELCYDEVARGSELHTNLRQMDTCATDLLGNFDD